MLSEGSVAEIRGEISRIIDASPDLLSKFVRLGFQDCVGGCDGCVDMSNDFNSGLDAPIDALQDLVDEYVNISSRADIWAMAALEGAYRGQANNNFLKGAPFAVGPFQATYNEFRLDHFGRADCGDDPKAGPRNRTFPSSIALDSQGVFDYFDEQFGFDQNQTVALMGAHTLGFVNSENCDFEDGAWTNNNPYTLTADYYYLMRRSPWLQEEQLQGDLFAFRVQEDGVPNGAPYAPDPIFGSGNSTVTTADGTTERPIMLNTDLALIRDFSDFLDTDTGEITCDFAPIEAPTVGVPACPFAQTIDRVRHYDDDPTLGAEFVNDFEAVFKTLLEYVGDTRATLSPVEGRVIRNEEECSVEEVSLGIDPRDVFLGETTLDIYECGGTATSLIVVACGGDVEKKEYSLIAEQLASIPGQFVVVVEHLIFLGPTPSNFVTKLDLSNAVAYAESAYAVSDVTYFGHSYGGIVVLLALGETCDLPWCVAFPGASENVSLPSKVSKAIGYGVSVVEDGAVVQGLNNVVPSRNETVPYFGYFGEGDSAAFSKIGESNYVELTYDTLRDSKTVAVASSLDHYSITNRVLRDNGDVLAKTSRDSQIAAIAKAVDAFMSSQRQIGTICEGELANLTFCMSSEEPAETQSSNKGKRSSNGLTDVEIIIIAVAFMLALNLLCFICCYCCA